VKNSTYLNRKTGTGKSSKKYPHLLKQIEHQNTRAPEHQSIRHQSTRTPEHQTPEHQTPEHQGTRTPDIRTPVEKKIMHLNKIVGNLTNRYLKIKFKKKSFYEN